MYEDDFVAIDLRAIVQILIDHRLLILLGCITAIASVVIVNELQPPEYRATAIVQAIGVQQKQMSDFSVMAVSDHVLDQLTHSLQENGITADRATLRPQLKINKLVSALELQVTDQDKDRAADIANLWAQVFTDHVNRPPDLVIKLENAEAEVTAANNALADSGASSEAARLETQLKAANQEHQDLVSEQTALNNVLLNIQALRAQEDEVGQEIMRAALPYLWLTVFALPEQALESSTPMTHMQLPLSTDPITQINSLKAVLESKQNTVTEQIRTVEAEIETLQQDYAVTKLLLDDLLLAQTNSAALFTELTTELHTHHVSPATMQIFSPAIEPVQSRNPIRTAVIAALISVIATTTFVFTRAWWLEEMIFIKTPEAQAVMSSQLASAD